jgi:hypothetical protein
MTRVLTQSERQQPLRIIQSGGQGVLGLPSIRSPSVGACTLSCRTGFNSVTWLYGWISVWWRMVGFANHLVIIMRGWSDGAEAHPTTEGQLFGFDNRDSDVDRYVRDNHAESFRRDVFL